jgi:cytochrome c biogenesis protein
MATLEQLPEQRQGETSARDRRISPFASVQLSVFLMLLMALTILLGAWCPQESQVGQQKVFDAFDRQTAEFLIRTGVSDIFHSGWFLALTGTITLNMIVVSFQRVFPKLKNYSRSMPFFRGREIARMPLHHSLVLSDPAQSSACLVEISSRLTRQGYKVQADGNKLRAESGKLGRLAPSVTHVGLLSLLAGITVTSWTGFNGFEPILLDQSLNFSTAKHAKLWVGKLPTWTARVDGTRRENYPTGEAKQWYSNLTVVDARGKELQKGEISVNNPLSYDGVDIYQSSWGLAKLVISFNGHKRELELRPMGSKYASFLPLDENTILILSLMSDAKELRVFAKRKEWQAPRLISQIPVGGTIDLGGVKMAFEKVLPVTGLQYKSDPGLPITYAAFAIIMVGVLLAAIPHRHVWVAVEQDQSSPGSGQVLYIGGTSRKAKVGFERALDKLLGQLKETFALTETATVSAMNTTKIEKVAELESKANV